jgi:hypothetical protein
VIARSGVARELRQVLAELELVSQVPAVNLESSGGDAGEDVGGKRPPGGLIGKDDRQDEYPQKSVEHFRRRIARARDERVLALILDDARQALVAARRAPAPTKEMEPKRSSPQWKRYVAESEEPSSVLARRFGVSGQYIREVRRKYRDQEEAA